MRRVAITGFGVVSPVGTGISAFWDALQAGISGIGPISHFDASSFDVRLAGEVRDDLELPEEVAAAARTDTKVGFGYHAAEQALRAAGIASLGTGCLLHLGSSLEVFDPASVVVDGRADFEASVRRSLESGVPLQTPLSLCPDLVARRFGRPDRTHINCSACAAGAQAIGHGFREVRAGRCRTAVCGGLDSMVNPLGIGGFQLLGALTTANDLGGRACRPFDAARSGTVLGEGAAVVVLEPLDEARADGREILAEVCGYASTLDACSLTAPDPEGEGAGRAMSAALEDAGLPAEAVGHVNAHGTGTSLNDEAEAKAIRRCLPHWGRVPVSAIKSVTGHLIAAAGAVEVGACLLPLTRSLLPPNLSLSRVGAGCELAHVTRPGQRFDGEYVLSNSFGFGGQNAVIIMRRYDG